MKVVFLFVVVLLVSCVKKDRCPAYPAELTTDKPGYNFSDPVRFKLLYSDRASCEWFIDGIKQDESGTELLVRSASLIYGVQVKCNGKIGSCKDSALKVAPAVKGVNMPPCYLPLNTISINGVALPVTNLYYDKAQSTFYGNISGASSSGSIKIIMPPFFNENYPESALDIFKATGVKEVDVQIQYSNSTYGTDYRNHTLIYTRQASTGNIKCCGLRLMEIGFPSNFINVNFSLDIHF